MADILALYATGETYPYGAAGHDFSDYLDLIWSREKSTGEAAWRQVLALVVGPTSSQSGYRPRKRLPQDIRTQLTPDLVLAGLEAAARASGATLATTARSSRGRVPVSAHRRPEWSLPGETVSAGPLTSRRRIDGGPVHQHAARRGRR